MGTTLLQEGPPCGRISLGATVDGEKGYTLLRTACYPLLPLASGIKMVVSVDRMGRDAGEYGDLAVWHVPLTHQTMGVGAITERDVS